MTNKKEKVGNAFCHIYLIVLSLIAVFPLVWVLLCSVKSSGELTSNPTRFFPKHFTLENFTHVIQDLGFAKNIGNSLIIAIITTGIAIVISSMAAYGIVRFFPKLGSIMSKVLVATYMFPPILLAIPYSMVMAKLGLVNTRIGLIIVYLSFSVPYAVWMLVGFFKTVPLGIEEAAKVDGANKFQTFIQIVLPLVMPGIVATAIYTFINTGGATAEAQIVEMPDGSLKTYLRTGSGYIAEVTSIDGGETWSDRVPLTEIATTSYGTQLSVINYSQPIDGKPAIILSAPNATNGRKNGKIWIGLINETGQSGVNKYSVEWKYCYSVDTPQMGYSYSCLTELPDGKVGLLYEKYDSYDKDGICFSE